MSDQPKPWGWIVAAVLGLLGWGYSSSAPDCPCTVVVPAVVTVDPPTPGPTVGIVGIVGPTECNVGRLVRLTATGTATRLAWSPDPEIESAENFDIDSDHRRLSFSSPVPGVFTFVIAGSDDAGGLAIHRHVVTVGQPKPPLVVTPDKPPVVTPDPTTRPTRATYVYEQRNGPIPPPVLAALSKLNVGGFVATPFDQNTISGRGQVPAQYAVALAEAQRQGLPCLVVQAGDVVLRVVKAPKTAAEVEGAVK